MTSFLLLFPLFIFFSSSFSLSLFSIKFHPLNVKRMFTLFYYCYIKFINLTIFILITILLNKQKLGFVIFTYLSFGMVGFVSLFRIFIWKIPLFRQFSLSTQQIKSFLGIKFNDWNIDASIEITTYKVWHAKVLVLLDFVPLLGLSTPFYFNIWRVTMLF